MSKFAWVWSPRDRDVCMGWQQEVHKPITFYNEVCMTHQFFLKDRVYNFIRFSKNLWWKLKSNGYMVVEMDRNTHPPSYNRRQRLKMHILKRYYCICHIIIANIWGILITFKFDVKNVGCIDNSQSVLFLLLLYV